MARNLATKCRPLKLILSDVDGVMTDGGVLVSHNGEELAAFHIRDGLAVKLWQEAGGRFGLVSGRRLQAVALRAEALQMDVVRLGVAVTQKRIAVEQILEQSQLEMDHLCYLGDDLPDLPVVRAAGLGVAVADASEEVRAAADYVTTARGGLGAVREVVELILKTNGQWSQVIAPYE